ncbi:ribonuclease E/G [Phenylobacterium immobile]|uniref:ribonuclease E/G n=1 Tax=Phenylobacterium immobile TaxID=21 RepID=UPI000AC28435|nr:ribonuclease E/G [Phenylobacterium immobile]
MSERRAYLDDGVGETRGVVTLDGRPERLLIRRDGDNPLALLGARAAARVVNVEPVLSSAFLDLGDGVEAMLPFRPEDRPTRGAMLRVEVRAEARRGKVAVVRALGEADGSPRLLEPPPSVAEALSQFVHGAEPVGGLEAMTIADEAQSDVLEQVFNLPGGGSLSIEPTRALTAIDVDLGERKGADSKRAARAANLAAIAESARLLRLKGLGGLVVIDLVGRGHDGPALLTAARTAFAPDNPGVAIGPVGKFGAMELSLPRRVQPNFERLCRSDGALSDESLAHRAIRALMREGLAQPGARLVAACPAQIVSLAEPMLKALQAKMGLRFALRAVDGARDTLKVSTL